MSKRNCPMLNIWSANLLKKAKGKFKFNSIAIQFSSQNPSNQTPNLSSQVRLWEGNQEEEVSFRPFGPSSTSADIWFHPAHHRPTY